MDKKECEICKQVIKAKHKRSITVWRTLAIIFMCLTVLFGTLYFANGDLFSQTVNDVEIVNDNSKNNNNNVVINN